MPIISPDPYEAHTWKNGVHTKTLFADFNSIPEFDAISFVFLASKNPTRLVTITPINDLKKALLNVDEKVNDKSSLELTVLGDSVPNGAFLEDASTQSFGALLANDLGMTYLNMCQNGSAVLKSSTLDNGILNSVCSNIVDKNGIIMIAIGQNDYYFSAQIGDVDDIVSKEYSELSAPPTTYDKNYTFAEGFRYTAETLRNNNPNTKIIFLYGMNQAVRMGTNSIGKYVYDYEDAEIKICNALGIETINIKQCGIPRYNDSTYYAVNSSGDPDGVHPNAFGHKLIARYLYPIIKEIAKGQSLMNQSRL